MKKFILRSVSMLLAITLFTAQSFGAYTGNIGSVPAKLDDAVFSFDEDQIENELSELNELDAYIEANEDVTFASLSKEGSPLLANVASSASPMGMAGGAEEPPLGIPSFLWGCVFGVVGLAVVYIMTEQDMDETKKALWGCVASTAVSVVLYLLNWGAWAASTDPFY
jgi:hypothetical protein